MKGPLAGERRTHRAALDRLGLASEAVTALEAYLDLLAAWNHRVNLTAARSAEERVAILVAPVLPLAPLLAPGRLLDVGSGNGSPGLVLAVLRPACEVVLLEPRVRRWAFLREAARVLGRPEIQALRLRHDAYAGPPAENVTLRALRLPLAGLAPLVVEGGRVFVGGSRPPLAGPFVWEAAHDRPGFHALRRVPVSRET